MLRHGFASVPLHAHTPPTPAQDTHRTGAAPAVARDSRGLQTPSRVQGQSQQRWRAAHRQHSRRAGRHGRHAQQRCPWRQVTQQGHTVRVRATCQGGTTSGDPTLDRLPRPTHTWLDVPGHMDPGHRKTCCCLSGQVQDRQDTWQQHKWQKAPGQQGGASPTYNTQCSAPRCPQQERPPHTTLRHSHCLPQGTPSSCHPHHSASAHHQGPLLLRRLQVAVEGASWCCCC